MQTGFRGTFAISWAQTELDGQIAAPVASLRAGQCWRWTGEALRLDGPPGILPLMAATGTAPRPRRAAHRLLAAMGTEPAPRRNGDDGAGPALADQTFAVTDGRRSWTVTLIETGSGKSPLIVFADGMPPRETDLWVVAARSAAKPPLADGSGGVICFTPGTLILTGTGPVPVESLAEGSRIQTKDNGCQPLLWIGRHRVTGARMRVMPDLAPVRLHEGALDRHVPDAGLLLSPDHRVVLRGARARALFNADEVLVAARDIVNDRTIRFDRSLPEVTYLHLLLPGHEIVFANGVETDSFHPASAELSKMDDGQHAALRTALPDLTLYGGFARRVLERGEAAILRRDGL